MKIALLPILLLLASCAGRHALPVYPGDKYRSISDEQECKRVGGALDIVCMFGSEICLVPYRDGGKPCKSSRECEGECRAAGFHPYGEKLVGQCAIDNNPCGCWTKVKGGKAAGQVCAD